MKIEIVSGSPREGSITYRIALHLKKYFDENTQHQTGIIDVREWNFPTLQEVVYSSVDVTPDAYKPLAERMFAADAFILVTPEYNGSYTPPLKNLFDHFPKQMHKAFGIVTGSTGGFGGIRASQQLQLLVMALYGIACPNMLIVPNTDKKFDQEGNLIDHTITNSLNTFTNEFLWLAERLAK